MEKITIAHGSGGKLTQDLIRNIFMKHMKNDILDKCDDSAVLETASGTLAFTTDSFVVNPAFFPGGDIGKIAVCGTVNDLAVGGARPKYITCALIIEEGFPVSDLEKIVVSMSEWARRAGVKIVTGDTKVVGKGEADGIFINTSGIGEFEKEVLDPKNIKPGDKVIVTGDMGDHGMAILSSRKGLELETGIKSDCAPLADMLLDVLENAGGVKFMRDPTRGGLATTLNEITSGADFGIMAEEAKLPVSESVRAACEILGMDPLYLANEGKAIIIADPGNEGNIINELKKNEYGQNAAVVGEVTGDNAGTVCLKTNLGTTRVVDMLTGEMLPRIC